jgi:16S rRNA (cytidine1402-2'-O)-methyltransferase
MPPPTSSRGQSDGHAAAGTLFVVATPIGNLEDITLRALRILGEVAVVAAEDTRRTGNLLRHYQISTPLISLHAHNEHARVAQILQRLAGGDAVAVVSDAGTPGISDPGAHVVKAARAAGFRVDPIPGPSAVTAVLSASGLLLEKFAFAGFPPIKAKDRNDWFAWINRLPDTPVVCFEAPHRVRRTLDEMRRLFGKRPILVARELTKAHEEWTSGDGVRLDKGEFVIIVGQLAEHSSPQAEGRCEQPVADEDIAKLFGEMTQSGSETSRRGVVKRVAKRLGLPTKAVYDALERAKT